MATDEHATSGVGSGFVGRARELGELRAGLASALSGRGGFFMVSGEPGIGKTRLVDELAAGATQQGVQVLWGRCWEGGGAPAFWPWLQIIRSYVRDRDPHLLAAQLGAGAPDVAQLVPEVRDPASHLAALATADGEQTRFRLFDASTTFLKNAAASQPLALIIDDLHAADMPSLLLLQFLVRELRDAAILVVVTYREAEIRGTPALTELVGELGREGRSVPLRGLTAAEVGEFIQNVLTQSGHPRRGAPTMPSPSQALVAAIHEATGGNPFFVDEIVRVLVAEGRFDRRERVALAELRIPDQVRESVRRRMRLLPVPTRELLTIAAVIGREFELPVLERVGRSTDSGAPLVDVLSEAVVSAIIASASGALGRYSFAHALLRETLYDDLAPSQRITLHRQIGAAMEQLYGVQSGPHLAAIAHHFFQAAVGGDTNKAIDSAVRAAEEAMWRLAYEEAVTQYQRALQVLDMRRPDAEASSNDTRRWELLMALGAAQGRAGMSEDARLTFGAAAGIARAQGAVEALAHAALGSKGSWYISLRREAEFNLLEEALEALGDAPSALRAAVLARLAWEIYWFPDWERGASLTHEAVELARSVSDRAVLVSCLEARHFATWGPATVEARLADADEMVRLAEELGDKNSVASARGLRATDLMELGETALAAAEMQTLAQLAQELRLPVHTYNVAVQRAMWALFHGHFEAAEPLIHEALLVGQRMQAPQVAGNFGQQMFVLRWEQGRLQELDGAVQGFVAQFPALSAWRVALAIMYIELGRETEAHREFEGVAAKGFADLGRDFSWLVTLSSLAEACALLDDAGAADTLYQLLLPCSGRNVVAPNIPNFCLGSAARSLGLLATTMCRWAEAEAHFEAALEANTRMGTPPWVAHTQHDYARMLVARGRPGDREQAHQLVEQALATARELGMKRLERKATALMENCGSRNADRGMETPSTLGSSIRNPQSEIRNVFHREGDYWIIAYDGETCRFKDAKGFAYIAHLLRYPSQEFHAIDVVAQDATAGQTRDTNPEIRDTASLGDAGEILDWQARAAYKQRLTEMRAELQEAEQFNDPGRVERAQQEIDFLTQELARAVGLGGRERRAGSHAERARVNVTRAITVALKKIAESHQALAQHLTRTIKTGTFCSYAPDPRVPIEWEL